MPEHPTFRSFRLIKLSACKDKRRQIILNLLCKGQQFLCICLFLPCLLGSLLLHSLLFDQELLIFAVLEQVMQSHCALSLRSLHRRQNGPSHINAPACSRFLYLLPELLPCAGKSLRKMCILLKCNHSNSF